MSLKNSIDELNKKLEAGQVPNPPKKKKPFEWKVKIPGKVSRAARREGVFAVLMLDVDKGANFTNGYYSDGLIVVGDKSYSFEEATVFWVKKKRIPLVVLYSWRLTPVSGKTDAAKHGIGFAHEKSDHAWAEELGLTNYGQQTIIRSIKQAQLPNAKKGFGGIAPIAWLFIGVGIIYVLSQFFGGV